MRAVGRVGAGEFRERITIEQRGPGQNARGQPNGAWGPVASGVPAKAEPLKGSEFFAAGATRPELSVRFTIRYRTGITEAMRVVWRGRPHEIVSPPIDVDGARDVLQLMCMSGVRDGA